MTSLEKHIFIIYWCHRVEEQTSVNSVTLERYKLPIRGILTDEAHLTGNNPLTYFQLVKQGQTR